jgi:hypothetical protein
VGCKVCNREGKVSMIRLASRAAGMQDGNEGGIEGYNEGLGRGIRKRGR